MICSLSIGIFAPRSQPMGTRLNGPKQGAGAFLQTKTDTYSLPKLLGLRAFSSPGLSHEQAEAPSTDSGSGGESVTTVRVMAGAPVSRLTNHRLVRCSPQWAGGPGLDGDSACVRLQEGLLSIVPFPLPTLQDWCDFNSFYSHYIPSASDHVWHIIDAQYIFAK